MAGDIPGPPSPCSSGVLRAHRGCRLVLGGIPSSCPPPCTPTQPPHCPHPPCSPLTSGGGASAHPSPSRCRHTSARPAVPEGFEAAPGTARLPGGGILGCQGGGSRQSRSLLCGQELPPPCESEQGRWWGHVATRRGQAGPTGTPLPPRVVPDPTKKPGPMGSWGGGEKEGKGLLCQGPGAMGITARPPRCWRSPTAGAAPWGGGHSRMGPPPWYQPWVGRGWAGRGGEGRAGGTQGCSGQSLVAMATAGGGE